MNDPDRPTCCSCHICPPCPYCVDGDRSQDFVMPFGKFKGLSLEDIMESEPAYLEWVYNNFEEDKLSEEIRDHIETVLGI